MNRYSQDHKFSKKISECFRDMNLWEFVNPISSYPWGGRNRIIGRIRVFEKYLKPEDVVFARWHHMQALKTMTRQQAVMEEPGVVYLNQLMDERSGGKFWEEIDAIAKEQPTVMEYANQQYGTPRVRVSRSVLKQQMRLIINPENKEE